MMLPIKLDSLRRREMEVVCNVFLLRDRLQQRTQSDLDYEVFVVVNCFKQTVANSLLCFININYASNCIIIVCFFF